MVVGRSRGVFSISWVCVGECSDAPAALSPLAALQRAGEVGKPYFRGLLFL